MQIDTGRMKNGAYMRLSRTEAGDIRFVVGYVDSRQSALDSEMTVEEARFSCLGSTGYCWTTGSHYAVGEVSYDGLGIGRTAEQDG